jgi:hypothetical protein
MKTVKVGLRRMFVDIAKLLNERVNTDSSLIKLCWKFCAHHVEVRLWAALSEQNI